VTPPARRPAHGRIDRCLSYLTNEVELDRNPVTRTSTEKEQSVMENVKFYIL